MAIGSKYEKNEGVRDDFQVPSLGGWIISSSLKYLYIVIHGITRDKDAPPCICHSVPHAASQKHIRCINADLYMEPHHVSLCYHYSSKLSLQKRSN